MRLRRDRREDRREGAEKRLTERAERDSAAQLKALDRRLGKGLGAKKERERLAA